jgi:hypothetical protein
LGRAWAISGEADQVYEIVLVTEGKADKLDMTIQQQRDLVLRGKLVMPTRIAVVVVYQCPRPATEYNEIS